jgi:hypothetical protein
LLGSNGRYLSRCSGCTSTIDNIDLAAAVDYTVTSRSIWTVFPIGINVGLQSDSGKFLARCDGCVRNSNEAMSAGVHANGYSWPNEQLTPVLCPNGKWALRADTGKYLSICNYCVNGNNADLVFINVYDLNDARAQWTVTVV